MIFTSKYIYLTQCSITTNCPMGWCSIGHNIHLVTTDVGLTGPLTKWAMSEIVLYNVPRLGWHSPVPWSIPDNADCRISTAQQSFSRYPRYPSVALVPVTNCTSLNFLQSMKKHFLSAKSFTESWDSAQSLSLTLDLLLHYN